MNAPDSLLLRWQQEEDVDALDELLRVEIEILKRRIRSKVPALPDPSMSVSDVAQEAVQRLLAVTPAPVFETIQAMRAYLWTAAWRLLIDSLRSKARQPLRINSTSTSLLGSAVATTGGLCAVHDREQAGVLEVALNLLSPNDREILDLVYFQALGIEAASVELGIKADAANTRLVRARRRLAERLCRWVELIG